MPVNKDIIIRFVLGLIFFIVTVRVLGPLLFEFFKRKIPGAYNPENDLDSMIKRQKERLRAQYGLYGNDQMENSAKEAYNTSTNILKNTALSKEVENLYKETRWGGGTFLKSIQGEISKNYSYTLADSKVNAFILLAEKRNYIHFLSAENQKSSEAIKNYLSLTLLVLMMIEEIRTKDLTLIGNVAKKCHLNPSDLLLALQLKFLFIIHQKKELKEDTLFSDTPILNQFSEDTIKSVIETLLKKEANLWAKGHSLFFEELSLFLNYAHILSPMPQLQGKKDVETAHKILGTNPEMDIDEIKKAYKKIALVKHPDKISSQNLPKTLEKKAISQFGKIQESYQIIIANKKIN
jgi:hypothetical protein